MLATALEMEKKGKEYYDRAARTTGNELGRKYGKCWANTNCSTWTESRKFMIPSRPEKDGPRNWPCFPFRAIWDRSSAGWPKTRRSISAGDTGDIEALGVGIDFESAAVKFYEDHAASAGDPLERKFSELMPRKSGPICLLLSDMKMYYEDPESWFMEKERSGLDGA